MNDFVNFFGNTFSAFWGFLFDSRYQIWNGITLGTIIIAIIFLSIIIGFFMRGGK